MPYIDTLKREVCFKLVYYGPGLGGKTESLKYLYSKVHAQKRGQMLSIKTETERTLFFDFVPFSLGKLNNLDVKFNFFTVPGQSFYNVSRRAILNGVDGIVFVADSQIKRKAANIDSLRNLHENLESYGYQLDSIPHVFQYNKRDLKKILDVGDLKKDLNKLNAPDFGSSAIEGKGILETFRALGDLVIKQHNTMHQFIKHV